MKTCWGMYSVTPTGLAAEITYFNIHDPPLMYNDLIGKKLPKSPESMEALPANLPGADSRAVGHADYVIKAADAHNLQRPETVESLFYMWRITGDLTYRNWGWKMFEAFMKHTAVEDRYCVHVYQQCHDQPPSSQRQHGELLAGTCSIPSIYTYHKC